MIPTRTKKVRRVHGASPGIVPEEALVGLIVFANASLKPEDYSSYLAWAFNGEIKFLYELEEIKARVADRTRADRFSSAAEAERVFDALMARSAKRIEKGTVITPPPTEIEGRLVEGPEDLLPVQEELRQVLAAYVKVKCNIKRLRRQKLPLLGVEFRNAYTLRSLVDSVTGQPAIVLFSDDVRAQVALLLWALVETGYKVSECREQSCKRFFARKYGHKQFCSDRCRTTFHNQQRTKTGKHAAYMKRARREGKYQY